MLHLQSIIIGRDCCFLVIFVPVQVLYEVCSCSFYVISGFRVFWKSFLDSSIDITNVTAPCNNLLYVEFLLYSGSPLTPKRMFLHS